MPRQAGASLWICDGENFIPWPTILAGLAGESRKNRRIGGELPKGQNSRRHHKKFCRMMKPRTPLDVHTRTGALQFPGLSAASPSEYTPLVRRCAFGGRPTNRHGNGPGAGVRRPGPSDSGGTRGGWRPPSYSFTGGATPSFRSPRSRLRVFLERRQLTPRRGPAGCPLIGASVNFVVVLPPGDAILARRSAGGGGGHEAAAVV